MPNTLQNILDGSLLKRGITGPIEVRLPHTDPGGIFDATALTANTRVTLNGSYCKNISADGFSADLRIPIVPVITTNAKTEASIYYVRGWDQFGKYREEILNKLATSTQTVCCSLIAWSRIKDITPTASFASRQRMGFLYATRLDLTAGREFETMATATNVAGITRRLPLPFQPKSASDIQVRFLGTAPEQPSTLITSPPVTATSTVTFTTTGATSSVTWDVSAIAAGDIAYTFDGYAGIITSAASDAIVVVAWFKDGVAGTPGVSGTGVVTNWANKFPAIRVIRWSTVTPYSTAVTGTAAGYSTTLGGLIPGHRVLPLTASANNLASDIAGIDLNTKTATWGFLPCLPSETPFDMRFEVTIREGARY